MEKRDFVSSSECSRMKSAKERCSIQKACSIRYTFLPRWMWRQLVRGSALATKTKLLRSSCLITVQMASLSFSLDLSRTRNKSDILYILYHTVYTYIITLRLYIIVIRTIFHSCRKTGLVQIHHAMDTGGQKKKKNCYLEWDFFLILALANRKFLSMLTVQGWAPLSVEASAPQLLGGSAGQWLGFVGHHLCTTDNQQMSHIKKLDWQ